MKDQEYVYFPHQGRNWQTFHHQEHGIKGVGKDRHPMLNMDKYLDHSMDLELHREISIGIAKTKNYRMGTATGGHPPEIREKYGMKDGWSEMLRELEKYDPDGFHKESIKQILETSKPEDRFKSVYKYFYFSAGSLIPWFFTVYIKEAGFFDKATDQKSLWTEDAKLFPKLIEYINALPFKSIGRILFFTTYPNAGVIVHRDGVVAEHKDHNINLFFTPGWRPSFVYDEITKEKVYLEQGARSYFFNNRDYHGVDPEPNFRYTLRIDGTFTDELQEELGLVDGYTWNWNYERNS